MRSVNLSLIRTTSDKLSSIPIQDGRFIVVSNAISHESEFIAYDDETGRHMMLSVVDLADELERLTIVPSPYKTYFVKSTELVYRYVDNAWVCLNDPSGYAKVVQVPTIVDLPIVGSSDTVYFITSTHKVYYWDDSDSHYYCAGSDWNDIRVIDANFADDT